jgi:ABC-2 type transport system permease protein
LEGHGELFPLQVLDFERNLRQYYNTYHFRLDTVMQLPAKEVDILLVAQPKSPFSEQDKFKIDQYLMNGGKVLWLIDKLNVNIDSVNNQRGYVPFPFPLELDNLWFKYGIRIDDNLVLDLECSPIPLKVGEVGGQPQFRLFPFFYHPVVAPKTEHPTVKSLDRIDLFFPSSIDTTVRVKTPMQKTVLLSSSQRSRVQLTPTTLDFEILREKPKPELFNQPFQPIAVLYDGIFPSAYENRVTPSMMDGLQQLGLSFKAESIPTKMIVVADGDIIRNDVRVDEAGKPYPLPLGQNPFDRYTYANKDFLLNAIEFLLDENGIIEARSKDVKLRLLNETRATAEQNKWQIINLVLPLVFLVIFGLIFRWTRKRRFA